LSIGDGIARVYGLKNIQVYRDQIFFWVEWHLREVGLKERERVSSLGKWL
jgi:hypothetical protein